MPGLRTSRSAARAYPALLVQLPPRRTRPRSSPKAGPVGSIALLRLSLRALCRASRNGRNCRRNGGKSAGFLRGASSGIFGGRLGQPSLPGKIKTLPMANHEEGGFWQRPTLAQPRDALPSGLQRFTSVFGMGTGGSTALGSPECEPHFRAGRVLPIQFRHQIFKEEPRQTSCSFTSA